MVAQKTDSFILDVSCKVQHNRKIHVNIFFSFSHFVIYGALSLKEEDIRTCSCISAFSCRVCCVECSAF